MSEFSRLAEVKHDINNGNRRNRFVEVTHAHPKVVRTLHAPLAQTQHNTKQEYTHARCKTRMNETPDKDKQTTTNNSRPATAATNSRNFRTGGHPKIPARKNGLNTSFSKENSECRNENAGFSHGGWSFFPHEKRQYTPFSKECSELTLLK